MLDYKTTLRQLCGIMSIPGCEREAAGAVRQLFGALFDQVATDAARNIVLVKKSKKLSGDAPKVLLDAHFDQVGMIVTDITAEGLLRVTGVGGIDRNLLPASEVIVYPKDHEPVYGVFAALAPHLKKPGDDGAPTWDNLLIDIGYSKEDAEKFIEIGTPVCYCDRGCDYLNGRIAGCAFDDKSCAAGLICAVADTPAEELDYDVYVVLSSGEEVGGGGAKCAAYAIHPDFAVITDVNFALTPGVSGDDGGKLGGGPMISLSAVTDRKLTKRILKLAEENEVPVSTTVEPASTGTNASCVVYANEGVPAAVVGIPLAGMHSYHELLQLDDAEAFIKLIRLIIARKKED